MFPPIPHVHLQNVLRDRGRRRADAHPFVLQDVLRAVPGVAKGPSFSRLHPHFDGVERVSSRHVRSASSCTSEPVLHGENKQI